MLKKTRVNIKTVFPTRVKVRYTKQWRQAQLHYEKIVRRARFLKEEEKDNWILLGYEMTTKELHEAANVILAEDLRRLKTKHQLLALRPTVA